MKNRSKKKFIEPELRPEFIEKMKEIEKEGPGEAFNSIEELRTLIQSD